MKRPLRFPFPPIINIGIGIGVLLVGFVLFAFHFVPLRRIERRKEDVRLVEKVVDTGDIEPVGQLDSLLINLAATDDEHLLFRENGSG